jgi:sortase B
MTGPEYIQPVWVNDKPGTASQANPLPPAEEKAPPSADETIPQLAEETVLPPADEPIPQTAEETVLPSADEPIPQTAEEKALPSAAETAPPPKTKLGRLQAVAVILGLLTLISGIAASFIVVPYLADLYASRNERENLLESKLWDAPAQSPVQETKPDRRYVSPFDAAMSEINPDYLCWIKIEDTKIDYPVVRSNDNEKYLNTSFSLEENRFGALFMDYRCMGEYVPHIIIYGHNIAQGDMFGDLDKYTNEDYLTAHPVITLKVQGRITGYEVFAARKTDVTDMAYNLDFSQSGAFEAFAQNCGAPEGTVQIVTLSTCAGSRADDKRVVVQAALRKGE